MVIRFSSVPTLTRIDLLATADSASSLSDAALTLRDLSRSGVRCCEAAGTGPGVSAEHALQFVERHFAGAERPFQRLRDKGAERVFNRRRGGTVRAGLLHHLLEP